MLISELISRLQKIEKEKGDLNILNQVSLICGTGKDRFCNEILIHFYLSGIIEIFGLKSLSVEENTEDEILETWRSNILQTQDNKNV